MLSAIEIIAIVGMIFGIILLVSGIIYSFWKKSKMGKSPNKMPKKFGNPIDKKTKK